MKFFKFIYIIFIILMMLLDLGVSTLNAQESMSTFIQKFDTLVVYKNVPEHTPSDFYTIRVRSAASNNQWVDCFANNTQNRAYLQTPVPGAYGETRNYSDHTDGWSHTYANIEMSKNSPVEVEIRSKNDFKINGQKFFKATTHPSHKATAATVDELGVVRFTIPNPALITIDINGQMDDYKVISNGIRDVVTDPKRGRVHTISLLANPVMNKPSLNDPNILYAEPGVKPSANLGTKKILYFKPGVHNIDKNFKLQPDKSYYIPGDAIVYGTFNNLGVGSGDNIKIYGYGTLSGDKLNHPNYEEVPAKDEEERKLYKPVHIDLANNSGIQGIFISNSAYHSVHLSSTSNYSKWVKIVTWRGNGDGIGTCVLMENCFIRTNDDCSYIKGNKKGCVFWKDAGGAVFHLSGITENKALVIEDCDVLYLRARENASYGKGVFSQRTQGATGQRQVNVLFKDIRIHDKYPNVPVFSLVSKYDEFPNDHRLGGTGSSFKGITFRNVSIAAGFEAYGPGKTQQIMGDATSPWYGGIIFDKCTLSGRPLSIKDFQTNAFVKDIVFINGLNINQINANSNHGISIYPNPVSDKLFVDSKNLVINKTQLIDLTGKVILTKYQAKQNESIDISGLNTGIYFVKVYTSNTVYTSKLSVK